MNFKANVSGTNHINNYIENIAVFSTKSSLEKNICPAAKPSNFLPSLL